MAMLTACKPGIPSEVIQPGDMEDILYDYHLALAILQGESRTESDALVQQEAYKLAVLKKHGVSEAAFEMSMEYYMRHADMMHDIYENLAERMEDEAMTQGVSASDLSQYGTITAKGDTADIWQGDRALVLSPDPPFNSQTFAIKADTAFHKGDKLMWNFNSQFIVQEGSRDAIAVLAVRFMNDSIASQVRMISSNMPYSIVIADNGRIGIKEVRGFVILNRNKDSGRSTLKLLFMQNIQLIRMHTREGNGDGSQSSTHAAPEAFSPQSPSPDELRDEREQQPQTRDERPRREFGNPPNAGFHPVPIKKRSVSPSNKDRVHAIPGRERVHAIPGKERVPSLPAGERTVPMKVRKFDNPAATLKSKRQ